MTGGAHVMYTPPRLRSGWGGAYLAGLAWLALTVVYAVIS